MPLMETVIELAQPWAKFYAKSNVAQVTVMFAHLGGMLGGGGLAIAADRAMWRARTASDDMRASVLKEVAQVHRPVLTGLAIAAVSGVLLTLSDAETYLPSKIFWAKIALFVLLLANGAWLQSLERGVQKAPATAGKLWPTLVRSSRFSWVLWFAVAFAGVLLVNA